MSKIVADCIMSGDEEDPAIAEFDICLNGNLKEQLQLL